MWDLKATHLNLQRSLVQDFRLYELELGYNATEAAKKISYPKF